MHGNIWLLDPSCSSSPSTEVLQALGNDDFVGQGKFPHGNIFLYFLILQEKYSFLQGVRHYWNSTRD